MLFLSPTKVFVTHHSKRALSLFVAQNESDDTMPAPASNFVVSAVQLSWPGLLLLDVLLLHRLPLMSGAVASAVAVGAAVSAAAVPWAAVTAAGVPSAVAVRVPAAADDSDSAFVSRARLSASASVFADTMYHEHTRKSQRSLRWTSEQLKRHTLASEVHVNSASKGMFVLARGHLTTLPKMRPLLIQAEIAVHSKLPWHNMTRPLWQIILPRLASLSSNRLCGSVATPPTHVGCQGRNEHRILVLRVHCESVARTPPRIVLDHSNALRLTAWTPVLSHYVGWTRSSETSRRSARCSPAQDKYSK